MQSFKQLGNERVIYTPNRIYDGNRNELSVSNSNKHQWVANTSRVPPRKVYMTDVYKLKNRLFAFNQKNCSLSIGNVVGNFRYISSWGKLLGITFSLCLILWSAYNLSIIKNSDKKKPFYDLFFYTNLTCFFSSAICLITQFISLISPNFKSLGINLMDNSTNISNNAPNSGAKTWSPISLKSFSIMYLLVAILAVFPISLFPIDSSQYLTPILSIILFAHLIPSILFYFAHLRGEDCRIEERRLNITI